MCRIGGILPQAGCGKESRVTRRDRNLEIARHAFIALVIIGLVLSFMVCTIREIAKDQIHHTGP